MKKVIERRLNFTNKTFLTEQEVKDAAAELSDKKGEEELEKNLVRREVERINQKLAIYKNNSVGSMT